MYFDAQSQNRKTKPCMTPTFRVCMQEYTCNRICMQARMSCSSILYFKSVIISGRGARLAYLVIKPIHVLPPLPPPPIHVLTSPHSPLSLKLEKYIFWPYQKLVISLAL